MQNKKELNASNDEILLKVNNLKMYFDITTGFFKTTPLKAVDNVSFEIKKGETLGVVGESGCGKTTLGRTIMNLYNASSGEIIFDGVSISSYSDLKKIKVEKKFELKILKYEYKKSLKQASEEEKVNLNSKYLADKNELIKKYDEKYIEKSKDISDSLNALLDKKNADIKALKVIDKATDNKTNEVDLKVNELKTNALSDLNAAKSILEPELVEAKNNKKNNFLKLKEKKQADKKLLASCKNNKKKIKKDNKVEERVMYEKIVSDYNVEKSKAIGKYQNTCNEINQKLEADIRNVRSTSEYYDYIDKVKDINDNYNLEVKKIKSSSKLRMKHFRKQCTMVFQDPYSSLNPRMTVQDIIAEPLDVNHLYSTKDERRTKVLELMKKVGLSPEQSTRYAHEFSGGQRQRIGIARALAVNPQFIVCDEPVSALDVSIQAQVINTFEDLQKDLGLTYLFIAHDLLVVRHISNRIAVMYLGKIVELAETDELFENPMHPYTISLLSAVPMPDPYTARLNKRIILEGDVPSPLNVPSGCPFRTRCSRACDKCKNSVPTLKEIKPGHFVSCILVQEENENTENVVDENINLEDTNKTIENESSLDSNE